MSVNKKVEQVKVTSSSFYNEDDDESEEGEDESEYMSTLQNIELLKKQKAAKTTSE